MSHQHSQQAPAPPSDGELSINQSDGAPLSDGCPNDAEQPVSEPNSAIKSFPEDKGEDDIKAVAETEAEDCDWRYDSDEFDAEPDPPLDTIGPINEPTFCSWCCSGVGQGQWAAHVNCQTHQQHLADKISSFEEPFFCGFCVCGVLQHQLTDHLESGYHQEKVEMAAEAGTPIFCKACDCTYPGKHWKDHVKTVSHNKKVTKAPLYVHCELCEMDVPRADWTAHNRHPDHYAKEAEAYGAYERTLP